MGPNDVELVRVYTRNPGGNVSDVTFPFDQDIEIVVDAEAGEDIFDTGASFTLNVTVKDLVDNCLIPTTPGYTHILGGSAWPTPTTNFLFTISAADLGPVKENHVCEVIAYLCVDHDYSFATSPWFIITPP